MSEEKSKVLLDNQRVRVLELRLPPGECEPMHSHPEYIVYVLSPATMRMTADDGSTNVVELTTGQVSFGAPTRHSGENIGETTLRAAAVLCRAWRAVGSEVRRDGSS